MNLVHLLLSVLSLCLSLPAQIVSDESSIAAETNDSVLDITDLNMSALEQLTNIRTVEGFVSILRTEEGNIVNMSDILISGNRTNGKLVVADGGGRLAEPDDCSPRLTTVRLNMSSADPKIVFFPRCTKIERCGGCCSSPNLECVPSYTERVTLKAIKAEVPLADSTMLVYKGFSNIIVERHLRCMVQCSLNAAKCGPSKLFVSNQCMCKCPEQFRCSPPHVWDPDVCTCVCSVKRSCCPVGEDCGLVFDNETCQCSIPTGIIRVSSNNNYTEAQIRHFLSNIGDASINENPSPHTQAEATTMTSATTVADNPCTRIVCPNNMVKVLNPATNRCGCRLQSRINRP